MGKDVVKLILRKYVLSVRGRDIFDAGRQVSGLQLRHVRKFYRCHDEGHSRRVGGRVEKVWFPHALFWCEEIEELGEDVRLSLSLRVRDERVPRALRLDAVTEIAIGMVLGVVSTGVIADGLDKGSHPRGSASISSPAGEQLGPKMEREKFPERDPCWVCGSPRTPLLSNAVLDISGARDDHFHEMTVNCIELASSVEITRIQYAVSHVAQCPDLPARIAVLNKRENRGIFAREPTVDPAQMASPPINPPSMGSMKSN